MIGFGKKIQSVDLDAFRAMERLMKHMGNEMGENFGDEMAEAIDSSEENRSELDESDAV